MGTNAGDMGRVHRVSDEQEGIRRVRSGRGFSYQTSGGAVRDETTLERIRAVAIPQAWTDVWNAGRLPRAA
jgi:DNA topoisomerase I